jgi:molybdopterin molybdotransferase
VIDFDEALARIARSGTLLGSEQVTIVEAAGRVLAEPVIAAVGSPPVDVSVMDGYAVREADLLTLPTALPVAGESSPSCGLAGELPTGTCVRIFTGAPIPHGADRVIVQEVVDRDGDRALFRQLPSPARHVRRANSDFAIGDALLQAGTLLRPGALIATAAADRATLTVARQPRVRLLSTGDELAEPGQARLRPGAIPDSVPFGVAALAAEWGAVILGRARVADSLATMEEAASEALADADVVVVTGGASVGDKDFAKTMFEPSGLELIFSKVSMKPGKPVWFGRACSKLVIGLPGNPTSALVTARLLLAPLLCCLTGRAIGEALRWRAMPLFGELGPGDERETFSRGFDDSGQVRLFDYQESSAQKLLAAARLLVRRPAGDRPLPAGSAVQVLDF